MDFFKKPSPLVSYIMIIIGTGIMGISLQNFYDPIGLVTGGFTGLAIVIKTATAGIIHGGIPLWFTNLAINIGIYNNGKEVCRTFAFWNSNAFSLAVCNSTT